MGKSPAASILVGSLLLVACATGSIRWAQKDAFALAITDNPAQQRFDLTLTSKASVPLCLSKEAWPSTTALPMGFDGATLIMSTSRKELLPTGSAYCPGGCGALRVEPGELVYGALPYAAFGDASAITADTMRTLVFEVQPFVCSN